jgi:hypothetical protein
MRGRPAAWPQVLDSFGTPLVIEPSQGQRSSDAGLLPIRHAVTMNVLVRWQPFLAEPGPALAPPAETVVRGPELGLLALARLGVLAERWTSRKEHHSHQSGREWSQNPAYPSDR